MNISRPKSLGILNDVTFSHPSTPLRVLRNSSLSEVEGCGEHVNTFGTINSFLKSLLLFLFSVMGLSPLYADQNQINSSLMMNASASMLASNCAGCHGSNGASKGPAIPTISGMSAEYFIKQMEGFKRRTIPSTIMWRIAQGYTSAEIRLIAEFFSSKQFVIAQGQQSNQKLADKGAKLHKEYCDKCHSWGGTSAEDNAGILAGQWRSYLEIAMQDYIFGERIAPKKMARRMRKIMKKEGLEGFKALIEFYAR